MLTVLLGIFVDFLRVEHGELEMSEKEWEVLELIPSSFLRFDPIGSRLSGEHLLPSFP